MVEELKIGEDTRLIFSLIIILAFLFPLLRFVDYSIIDDKQLCFDKYRSQLYIGTYKSHKLIKELLINNSLIEVNCRFSYEVNFEEVKS